MHYVYIIYSPLNNRFYIGETCNISERINQHNSGHYIKASTKFTNDWELYVEIECTSKTQALKLERFIKKMRNRKFYEKLKFNKTLQEELLVRFS